MIDYVKLLQLEPESAVLNLVNDCNEKFRYETVKIIVIVQ